MKDSLYIVIPAYNEAENLEELVKEWYRVLEQFGNKDSRLVIVNDGSKDNSAEILEKLKKEYEKLVPLTKKNGGHGSTVLYGYKYAIEKGADYIFQTDSDRQTNPDEFIKFWMRRKEFDAIIGERVHRGDGRSRKMVENVVCLLLKLFFGVKVKDANAPYRLMKSELVAKYIDRMPENYNLPNIMFTTYFVYYGHKVHFEEISFKPREKGTNSINIKKIFKIGFNALKDFTKFRREM